MKNKRLRKFLEELKNSNTLQQERWGFIKISNSKKPSSLKVIANLDMIEFTDQGFSLPCYAYTPDAFVSMIELMKTSRVFHVKKKGKRTTYVFFNITKAKENS